jgi:hypothetical protein
VWYGRQSYSSYAGSIIFGVILLLLAGVTALAQIPGSVFFAGLFALFALFDWALVFLNVISSEYFVSNKRIFIKHGIIGRNSHDLRIEWMTGTVVQQGLFGRMLNFGDVAFTGAGFSGDVKMNGVSNVLAVKGIVENVIQRIRDQPTGIPRIIPQPSGTAAIEAASRVPQDTKFCQFCGFKMPLPAQFCPSCGSRQL